MYLRPLLHTIDRLPLFLAGAGGVLVWSLLAVSVEAGVLGLLLPVRRKFQLAFVINAVSTAATAAVSPWAIPVIERWAAALLGIHPADPALYQVGGGRPSLLLLMMLLASWAASVLLEGAALSYLGRRLDARLWLAALAANSASYLMELALLQDSMF